MGLKYKLLTGLIITIVCISCKKHTSAYNDSQVFRYNEHSNITTLDPAFAKDLRTIWATGQLFNGLVQLNDELEVYPDIAKKWSISEDGKQYVFELKNDVYFHRHSLFGTPMTRNVTAKDFEYSFNRLTDPVVASPGKWVMNYVESYKAVNEHTFVINLKQSFPPFLSLLSMEYCSVVPKEAIEYFGDTFRANPIGTGPFKFKLWVENTKLVFRKNNFYHEKNSAGVKLPYLEAVAITFLPDKQSEFLQFIQGNLDFLNSIDVSYKDDLLTQEGSLQKRYAAKMDMVKGAYLNTEYLGVYLDSDIDEVKSKKIRKAINYGFDREKMILYLRNGIGTPALNGFIPKGLPSFNNQKGYTYQPEKAKQLIDEYKKESGNESPSITINTDSQYLDLCEYIQRELEKIGLSVKIDVMPPSTLRQTKVDGKLSIFRGSWVADYPDAENYLFIFQSSYFSPNGPNYTHYNNPVFDTLYKTAIKTVDKDSREKLYQKMDSILIEDAPVIPLYYDVAVRFTRKNISGLGINPINHLHLKNVQKQ